MAKDWKKELRDRYGAARLFYGMHDPSRYAGVVHRGMAVLGGEKFLEEPQPSGMVDLTSTALAASFMALSEVLVAGGDEAEVWRAIRILGQGLVDMATLVEQFGHVTIDMLPVPEPRVSHAKALLN